MSGDEMIRATAGELRNFINAKAIIGDPLDLGDKVVFSIASFGFGFGAGSGSGKQGEGEGGGGGAGGGVHPVALLVVHKDVRGPEGVQIYSLQKKGQLSEVIETIGESLPATVERIAGKVIEMKKTCAEEECVEAPEESGE
ncbi:spore germination protein GerW family protein [Methanofollis fontis]|uniref:Sporulation protein n=1 Tax=Methanofollis fontis TaxID=2052832 RepID=A0A483CWH9_9EURY|nr:spore germination protein GerW family protein [Methanofollis fontis]TAJ45550.1 sporulation protein [Methanofollis fontis]